MRSTDGDEMRKTAGYIMVETLVAMAVLSIGLVGVHKALREGIKTRGIARDATHARFLLDQKMAELELRPFLFEGTESGSWRGEFSRFKWRYRVEKVELPLPPLPEYIDPQLVMDLKMPVSYMGRISVTISWARSGQRFTRTAETLIAPERLIVPPEEEQVLDEIPGKQ